MEQKAERTQQHLRQRSLAHLRPGESGIITTVGAGSAPVKRRLVDMGLTPGTEVTVRKVAPLGDPIEVNLRRYELSLRKEDAQRVTVVPTDKYMEQRKAEPQAAGRKEPDEETLRRMAQDHIHEGSVHGGPSTDYRTHDQRDIRIALAGNPNCGKTTLFNALTGSNQYVGNWPGVTVEKKEGHAQVDGHPVTIVDLPGIYSLSPYSMEEIVARDYIVAEHPDCIIDIVDATNIERNLYLTVQLMELERPIVLALNFMDEVEKHGDHIDIDKLSKTLGIPVVPVVARSGENIEHLLRTAHQEIHIGVTVEPDDLYDEYTHEIHHRVGEEIHDLAYAAGLPAHWSAIKLLEGDKLVEQSLGLDAETKAKVDAIAAEYEAAYDLGDRETLLADSRYRFIQNVVDQTVVKGQQKEELTLSDKIDRVVTHRFFAIPVFLLVMLCMFTVTFGPGQALSDLVESLIGDVFSPWVESLLTGIGTADWVVRLLVDGVIGGVGGVLVFLPQIAILFIFLSFLEDSGYMARAAFIMDRLLQRFGLSGKAFIPMLMGFGCSVPAVMGARTMENEKDRRMTIMLIPFMSCSARLPVYGLITSAFFPDCAGLVVFSLYLLGLVCAIASGLILKHTVFKGDSAPFLLELPPYRMPTLRNITLHVWEKVRGFLVKAGTLILAMSVVLWFLQSFGPNLHMVDSAADSLLGVLGTAIAPAFTPLGFGTWQAAVALLTGFIAKEMVVSSMSLFYGFSLGAGTAVVADALSGTFATPAAAYAFLVFVLLYVPCVAAISTIYREMNSLKWTLASVGWQLLWAWGVSFLAYHIVGLFL